MSCSGINIFGDDTCESSGGLSPSQEQDLTDVVDKTQNQNATVGNTNFNGNLTLNGLPIGNVSGPITSADNGVCFYNGTTGKIIKEVSTIKYSPGPNCLSVPDLSTTVITSLNTDLQKISNISSAVQQPTPITTLVGELDVQKIKSYQHNVELEFDDTNAILTATNINLNGIVNCDTIVNTPTIKATQIYPTTTSLKLNGNVIGGVSDTYIQINSNDMNIVADSDITLTTSDYIILQGKVDLNNAISTSRTLFDGDQELITKKFVDDSVNLQNAYDRGPAILTTSNNAISITGPSGIQTEGDIKVYGTSGANQYATFVSRGNIVLKQDNLAQTNFGSINYLTSGSDKSLNLQVDKGNSGGANSTMNIQVDGQTFSFKIDQLDMNAKKIRELGEPTLAQDAATKNYVDTAVVGLGGKIKVVFDSGQNYVSNVNPIWEDTVLAIGWSNSDIIQLTVKNAPANGNISYYGAIGNLIGVINTYGTQIAIGGQVTSRAVQRIWLTPSDPVVSGISNYKFSICNLPNATLTVEKW